jgi:ring-1,2-phenylacetyl-CoA epoxidase subunit PaaE
LIYSNASPETAIFKTELEKLAARFPQNFKIEFIFSNSQDLSRAHLHRELLVYFLQKFNVTSPEKTLAFTCGPKEYMRMCTYGFRFVNIPPANIRKEIFNIEKAIPKIEPPDTEQHLVTIIHGKESLEIPVRFPVSILQAARNHGLKLPYICETGKCGKCVAKCTEGKIWMAYNEVLTERDLQKGLILTCVGFPIHGNVTVEIGK